MLVIAWSPDTTVTMNNGFGPYTAIVPSNKITVAPLAALFTPGAEVVNFNALTSDQKTAIAGGADIYHGLGGNDVVTLPDKARYNESVDGKTLGWIDSAGSPFNTGSKVGDTYTVTGSDGDYFIIGGAGSDSVTINGDGDSAIRGGLGNDWIQGGPGPGKNTAIFSGTGSDYTMVA